MKRLKINRHIAVKVEPNIVVVSFTKPHIKEFNIL